MIFCLTSEIACYIAIRHSASLLAKSSGCLSRKLSREEKANSVFESEEFT